MSTQAKHSGNKVKNYSFKLKITSKIVFSLLLTTTLNFTLLTLNLPLAIAQTMSSQNYVLHAGEINQGGGSASNKNYTIDTSIGGNTLRSDQNSTYSVKSGVRESHTVGRFSFSISEMFIDFGQLYPTNPIIRTNRLSIESPTTASFSVIAYEDQPLKSSSGSTIPNTTCDTGLCTSILSAPWTSTLTYGFGYRCDNIAGNNCAPDFTNSTYYKQFADTSKQQQAQTVLKGIASNQKSAGQISYKINISGTQSSEAYATNITFLAVPSY